MIIDIKDRILITETGIVVNTRTNKAVGETYEVITGSNTEINDSFWEVCGSFDILKPSPTNGLQNFYHEKVYEIVHKGDKDFFLAALKLSLGDAIINTNDEALKSVPTVTK